MYKHHAMKSYGGTHFKTRLQTEVNYQLLYPARKICKYLSEMWASGPLRMWQQREKSLLHSGIGLLLSIAIT